MYVESINERLEALVSEFGFRHSQCKCFACETYREI